LGRVAWTPESRRLAAGAYGLATASGTGSGCCCLAAGVGRPEPAGRRCRWWASRFRVCGVGVFAGPDAGVTASGAGRGWRSDHGLAGCNLPRSLLSPTPSISCLRVSRPLLGPWGQSASMSPQSPAIQQASPPGLSVLPSGQPHCSLEPLSAQFRYYSAEPPRGRDGGRAYQKFRISDSMSGSSAHACRARSLPRRARLSSVVLTLARPGCPWRRAIPAPAASLLRRSVSL